jgi:hypothetical protein
VAVDEDLVAGVDGGGLDLDEDLVGSGFGDGFLLEEGEFSVLMEDKGFHVFGLLHGVGF